MGSTSHIRFATPDEVLEHTGCKVGSVPPFGLNNPEIPFFVDTRIFEKDFFMFNPARPDTSFRISVADLKRIYEFVPNPVSLFTVELDGTYSMQSR